MSEELHDFVPVRAHSSSTILAPSDRKNELPTPPGSPEDLQMWPQDVGHAGNNDGQLHGGRDPNRGLRGPPINIQMKMPKMENYNFPQSTNPTIRIPAFPGMESMASMVPSPLSLGNPLIARALATTAPKRYRGEKKPIPDTQKDGKYFERRKRNNLAAKKSRDARKTREDQIAMRANILEKENAILKAQVSTLREEANSLRQLLIQKRINRTM